MANKKDLTIEEYKETLLDEIEEDSKDDSFLDNEQSEEEVSENKKIRKTKKTNKNSHKFINKSKKNKLNFIINIIFTIIFIIISIITIDIILVAKYNKGPYFAIKMATYKDGGTKVYYGLGYKVIKYNQIQGRRDMAIGTWNLKYSTEPTDVSALDLAIEFTNNPSTAYKKYYKKFLRVNGNFISNNKDNNTLTFGYIDDDKKYSLNIVCKMAEENLFPENIKENDEVTVIGTVTNYKVNNDKNNKTLYINNCFAE